MSSSSSLAQALLCDENALLPRLNALAAPMLSRPPSAAARRDWPA